MEVGLIILAICALAVVGPRFGTWLGTRASDLNQARYDRDRRYMAEVRRQP
jgi:hypothetical protein